jgi:hypothetical protein
MFDPVSSVPKQGRDFHGDKVRFEANIAFSFPILSRPAPNVTEHFLMQCLGILVV